MKHSRAKNLNAAAVAEILGVLDGWRGRLTWLLLIEAVENRLGQHYTRQALHNHERIASAFRLRKSLASALPRQRPSRLDSPRTRTLDEEATFQRISRLEAENERLNSENHHLLEQFVRWAYNAHIRGIDKASLDRPLPRVNRQQTEVTAKRRSPKER